MDEIKLDGYCGLYCGGCDVYRLSEKGRQTGVKAKWQEMPEQFRKVIKETDIVCHGRLHLSEVRRFRPADPLR